MFVTPQPPLEGRKKTGCGMNRGLEKRGTQNALDAKALLDLRKILQAGQLQHVRKPIVSMVENMDITSGFSLPRLSSPLGTDASFLHGLSLAHRTR